MVNNSINTNNNIYRQIIEYKKSHQRNKKPPQTHERQKYLFCYNIYCLSIFVLSVVIQL